MYCFPKKKGFLCVELGFIVLYFFILNNSQIYLLKVVTAYAFLLVVVQKYLHMLKKQNNGC